MTTLASQIYPVKMTQKGPQGQEYQWVNLWVLTTTGLVYVLFHQIAPDGTVLPPVWVSVPLPA